MCLNTNDNNATANIKFGLKEGVMSSKLFKEGGPNQIKDLGDDQFQMSVSIPTDSDGRLARECTDETCSPGYFKVTPGTGIIDGQEIAYCPYCRHEGEPSDFTTQEQLRYAKDTVLKEAESGINNMMKDALGLGPSGKKKMGGDFLSIEMTYKPGSPRHVRRPYEDEVRRDVICPHCKLDQTVFGLAVWCADCGEDIFLTHVLAEISVTKSMLKDIDRRQEELGKRVAAKDLENCLEDAVSIFEASVKAIVRRALTERGDESEAVDAQMKKIGNSFQSTDRSIEQLSRLFEYSPAESDLWNRLNMCFEKRHPVTHNLGVVDKKYLERVKRIECEGREVRISEDEVAVLLSDVYSAIADIHMSLIRAGA